MEITREKLDSLIDSLHGMSSPSLEFELYENYPGRGMYGKACIGFTTDKPLTLHGAICALIAESTIHYEYSDMDDEPEFPFEWFELSPQTDSMGLSSILYYTNLTLV
jgi:hypothetical protein